MVLLPRIPFIPIPFIFRRKLTYVFLLLFVLVLLIIRTTTNTDAEDYRSAISLLNQQINGYLGAIENSEMVQENVAEKQPPQLLQQNEDQLIIKGSHGSSTTDESVSDENKAVIVMYSKNSQMNEILETLRTFELRLNRSSKGKYDFLILLQSRPSNALKSMLPVMTSSKIHIVNIRDELRTPKNYKVAMDKNYRAELAGLGFQDKRRNKLKHIQRFLTLGLFDLPEMQDYEYFWLLNDAKHRLACDITVDPLQIMEEESRKVGFMFFNSAHNPYQIYEPIWDDLQQYHLENNIVHSEESPLSLITDDETGLYNQCQFQTFGMMGHIPFFQSDEYRKIVTYLNDLNGMKYSLLTDSVIFTMAFTSLLTKQDFRLFEGIGLSNMDSKNPLISCPEDPTIRLRGKCTCNPIKDTLWEDYFGTEQELEQERDNSCISNIYQFLLSMGVPEDISARKQVIQKQKEEERIKAELKQSEFDQIMEEAGLPVLELQEGDEPVERYDRFPPGSKAGLAAPAAEEPETEAEVSVNA